MQTLRLVGSEDEAVPVIDVQIYLEVYAALCNIGSPDSYISPKVVEDYVGQQSVDRFGLYNKEGEMVALNLHVSIGSRLILHPFYIDSSISYDVILGADFHKRYGYTYSLGKFSINQFSPVYTTAQEVRYWKNRKDHSDLEEKKFVNVTLKQTTQSRILSDVQMLTREEWRKKVAKKRANKNYQTPALYPSDDDFDTIDLHPSHEELTQLNDSMKLLNRSSMNL